MKHEKPDKNPNQDLAMRTILKSWKAEKLRPRLLLHACCAPCSTTPLEILAEHADVAVYFFNPNISPEDEYERRRNAMLQFIDEFNLRNSQNIRFVEGDYCPDIFLAKTNLEKNAPEGGTRCSICYRMRLEETARKAAEMRCAYFASTLTLSPKKNSTTINRCGFEIQELSPLQYLPSDFKKNNGFLRSIALCNTYNLYRQTYCGCIYSNPAASKPSIAISD